MHKLLHFLIPLLIARVFFSKDWKRIWLLLCLTMLVDLDHLFANPIYDANRCSINFHFLHSMWAIGFYLVLLIPVKSRVIGIGLLVHMLLDWQECWFRIKFWFE